MSMQEMLALYSGKGKPTTTDKREPLLNRVQKLYAANKLKALTREQAPIEGPFHIAICLVIVDKLHHEEIWRSWMESAPEGFAVNLVIHAKHPDRITSEWVRQHTLDITYNPEWNSPEVIRAMLAVLARALEDPHCHRFIFGTETCIPIWDVGHTCRELMREDASWLNAWHRPNNRYEETEQFGSVDRTMVPQLCVWKALPGWIMLTRKHAQAIVDLPSMIGGDELWPAFRRVFAPEEVYFPTMLAVLGVLRPNAEETDEVVRKSVTHAQWAKNGDARPVTFDVLTRQLLTELRETGSLFARKFGPTNAPPKTWQRLVLGDSVARPQSLQPSAVAAPSDDGAAGKRKRDVSGEAQPSERKQGQGNTEEGESGENQPPELPTEAVPATNQEQEAGKAQPSKMSRTA